MNTLYKKALILTCAICVFPSIGHTQQNCNPDAITPCQTSTKGLWMKDTKNDNGCEPSAGNAWESPDIWIYSWNSSDWATTGLLKSPGMPIPTGVPPLPTPFLNCHPDQDQAEDPYFQNEVDHTPRYIATGYNTPVWIYVKVRNHKDAPGQSSGTEVLKVYWAKASTGLIWPTSWTGLDGRGNFNGLICPGKVLYLGDEITKPRKNSLKMTPTEISRLQEAFRDLNENKTYRGAVSFWFKQDEIHQATHVHQSESFLPWHRELVNRLENLLREVHPEVKLPYWDWQTDPTQPDPVTNTGTPLLATIAADVNNFMGMASGRVRGSGYGSNVGSNYWKSFDLDNCCSTDNGGNPCPWYDGNPRPTRGISGCPGTNLSPCVGSGNYWDPPEYLIRGCGGGFANMNSDINNITFGNGGTIASQYENFQHRLDVGDHTAAHNFLGASDGVNTGNILDQHTSFMDPLVFVLHAEVDRMFAKWQRYYAADANNNHAADNNYLRRLVPNDVYGDDRDHSKKTSDQCDLSSGWAIKNSLEPWAGGTSNTDANTSDNTSTVLPWDGLPNNGKGGRSVVKNSLDPSVVTPPIYDDVLLTIPVLQPGEACIMQIPWFPPDPTVASCTGDEGHYCLLARIERNTDPGFGMDFTEGSDLNQNVPKNNNIAWKNVEILPGGPDNGGPPNAPPPPPPPHLCTNTPCTGIGEVLVHNVEVTRTVNTKLVFGPVTRQDTTTAATVDSVVINLGPQLHALWVAGGRVSYNVHDSPCDSNETTVVTHASGGWIGNIAMAPDEMETLNLAAIPSATQQFVPYQFRIEQYATGYADTLIGGETFKGNCDSAWAFGPPDDNFTPPSNKTTAYHGNLNSAAITEISMTVYPSPASLNTRICIDGVPANVQVVVEVLDILGHTVQTLYNAKPDAECGLSFTLDCSRLEDGVYYAHIKNGNIVRTVKFMVAH